MITIITKGGYARMITRAVSTGVFVLLMGVVLAFSGCGGEKGQAEFDFSDVEYSIVQDGRYLYTVKATGTIRNIGTADARDVVITGGCPSCGSAYRQVQWHLTDTDKADEQKDDHADKLKPQKQLQVSF